MFVMRILLEIMAISVFNQPRLAHPKQKRRIPDLKKKGGVER